MARDEAIQKKTKKDLSFFLCALEPLRLMSLRIFLVTRNL